jgi:hypothetical protein
MCTDSSLLNNTTFKIAKFRRYFKEDPKNVYKVLGQLVGCVEHYVVIDLTFV